ncbi:MAG TPA: DUF2844 domain-containing protein [Steroidobacteraceae bacterium]|jgi:hypothetical protein|nr:DUF2844 domain-containing protein [Steroidobacteraceae bacterium]
MLTRTVLGSLIIVALATPALGALGGDVTSVEADRVRVKGALQVMPSSNYTVHEIQTSKLVLHEYVSLSGQVFAISWRGEGIPDLQQVLGTYYQTFRQASAGPHYNHHQLTVNTPDVVVLSSGHTRGYSGRAWVPALMPQNFSLKDIS